MNDLSVISKELAQDIAWAISVGNPEDDACRAYNVSVKQWRSALKNSREFRDILAAARSKFLVCATRDIAAGARNWKALSWLLERMYPERFGRRAPFVQITNTMNNNTGFVVTEDVSKQLNDVMNTEQKRIGGN
jgi:hypothetical protein